MSDSWLDVSLVDLPVGLLAGWLVVLEAGQQTRTSRLISYGGERVGRDNASAKTPSTALDIDLL